MGWRRTARLSESQEHGPFLGVTTTSFTAPVLSNSSSARPPRAANASPSPRTAIPSGIALLALALNSSPKLAPILRPVSASLRLRCRSAAFAVARWDFISILLTANRVKSLFKRAGDGIFARSFRRGARLSDRRVLPLRRAGGASRHSEWVASAQPLAQFFARALAGREMLRISTGSLYPVLCPHINPKVPRYPRPNNSRACVRAASVTALPLNIAAICSTRSSGVSKRICVPPAAASPPPFEASLYT